MFRLEGCEVAIFQWVAYCIIELGSVELEQALEDGLAFEEQFANALPPPILRVLASRRRRSIVCAVLLFQFSNLVEALTSVLSLVPFDSIPFLPISGQILFLLEPV